MFSQVYICLQSQQTVYVKYIPRILYVLSLATSDQLF